MSRPLDRLKRVLRPIGAVAGLTGAAAVVNRALQGRNVVPHDHLGGVRKVWNWRGFRLFATESGSGPLVILVHGIYAGASSYEYRRLFPLLARRHRVVAFDFLGCGLSEMPNIDYTPELFVEQIVDALAQFGSEPTTIVASSLGAAFAIRAATRAEDRVAALVLIAPTGLEGVLDGEPAAAQVGLMSLIRSPVLGESFYNALVSRPSLRYFLRTQSYANETSITPEVLDHYESVTHQPGARFVPAHFIGGALNCNVARDLPFVRAPLLILWGEAASRTNPVANGAAYVRLARAAQLETFPISALLPHEEEPEATVLAIERFLTGVLPGRPRPVSEIAAPQ